jgi:hypothetical protein
MLPSSCLTEKCAERLHFHTSFTSAAMNSGISIFKKFQTEKKDDLKLCWDAGKPVYVFAHAN